MKREEAIYKAAEDYAHTESPCETISSNSFIAGAIWADEHPNFENVWYDASEEPKDSSQVLIYFLNKYGKMACRPYHYIYWSDLSWSEVVDIYHIKRWAYISDLLPKGGEK